MRGRNTPLPGVLSTYGMGGDFLAPHYLQRKIKPLFHGQPLLHVTQFEELLNITRPPPVTDGSKLEYGTDGISTSPRMFTIRVLLQGRMFLDYPTGEHELSERLQVLDQPKISAVEAVLVGESPALRDHLYNLNVSCQLFEAEGAEHSFDYQGGHKEILEQVFQVLRKWFE